MLPPFAEAAQPQTVRPRPPRLRAGDTVGLIQPAGFAADLSGPQRALETIRAMGLVPKPGAHLYDRNGYLAGTDEARAADVNAMFADREVRAIFTARGGWGCARILPFLNWEVIGANPKLLVGFSDITALHLAIAAKCGFPTVHGPTAGANWGPQSLATFRTLAFDGGLPFYPSPAALEPLLASPIATPTGPAPLPGLTPTPGPAPAPVPPPVPPRGPVETIRPGRAAGRLLGGNLTIVSTLMGTPFLPSLDGAVLFLEDVEEAVYSIDRMLTQLVLSGALRRVSGVVFGRCARCAAGAPNSSFSLSEILARHLRPLGVPAFSGAMIGHIANQLSLPVGVRVEIDADAGTIRALEPAVA